MKLSVVIPAYNAEETITRLADDLVKALRGLDIEIVLVNDGSKDKTDAACVAIAGKYAGLVTYICLAKNFGEHNAVLAGLNYTSGDYVVIIDDDFQNPPEEIKKLVAEASDKGYDAVYGRYEKKCHSLFRNFGSSLNDKMANILLKKPKGLYLSSFKCLNRFMIKEIIKYRGPFPYIDGLILNHTRNIGEVTVQHARTRKARSGYTLGKLAGLWLNMFTNYSVYPLRISTLLGFLLSTIGGLAAISVIIEKLIHPEIPVGITSILVAILVFSGVQLMMLGLIGEYVGKQFLTSNQTPQYVVKRVLSKGTPGKGYEE